MNDRFLLSKVDWRERFRWARSRAWQNAKRHWYKFGLLILAGFLLQHKDLSIDLHLNGGKPASLSEGTAARAVVPQAAAASSTDAPQPRNTSLITAAKKPAARTADVAQDDNPANTFSNLSFGSAADEDARARAEKRRKQLAYVDHYVAIARREMEKYGIPASITLAQGLLESNVGESRLARKNNNHFGIKCFSKSCRKGHCSNFTDDHHKDFFRIYANARESYRAHSSLLKNNKRYQALFDLDPTDYRAWAHGLKKAGYATDKHYAYKIIGLIEDLRLYRFDK